MIETRDLTKRYGPLTALDKLTLTVADGEVFGFIGPTAPARAPR